MSDMWKIEDFITMLFV